jgi:hypothetical protein
MNTKMNLPRLGSSRPSGERLGYATTVNRPPANTVNSIKLLNLSKNLKEN